MAYGANYSPGAISIGDFNGDGTADLAVANTIGGVSILLGNGDGTFQPPGYRWGTDGNDSSSVAVGDVNVDGEPDLVVTDYDGNFVDVLLGLGGNSFELVEPCSTCANVPASVGVHPLSVAIADVNGDGKPDLATANSGSGNVSILLGNGDGTFQAQLEFSTGSQSAPRCV